MKARGATEDRAPPGVSKTTIGDGGSDGGEQLKGDPRNRDRALEGRVERTRRSTKARGDRRINPKSARQPGSPLAQHATRAAGPAAVLIHALLALQIDRLTECQHRRGIAVRDVIGVRAEHVKVVQFAQHVLDLFEAPSPDGVPGWQKTFDYVAKPFHGNTRLMPWLRRLRANSTRVQSAHIEVAFEPEILCDRSIRSHKASAA